MSFAEESGYLPTTIPQIMSSIRENVNTQFGTNYDEDTFAGTNLYKYFYALAQREQLNEVKTSEIFLRMQEYFNITNEKIVRPNTTAPGLLDFFDAAGFLVSLKKPEIADAGKLYICVDVSDPNARGSFTVTSYANLVSGTDDSITVGATVFTAQVGAATPGATTFQAATSNTATAASLASQINAHVTAGALVSAEADGAIVRIRARASGTGGNAIVLGYTDHDTNVGATKSGTTLTGGRAPDSGEVDYLDTKQIVGQIIKDCVVAGVVTQGTEIENITLPNGQTFPFKYNLPTKLPILLKLTVTLSDNNQYTVLTPEDQAELLLSNITARYKLGQNFEPQRYFSVVDAPWGSMVLLEYSLDAGMNWLDDVYVSDYDKLLTFELGDIEIVEV